MVVGQRQMSLTNQNTPVSDNKIGVTLLSSRSFLFLTGIVLLVAVFTLFFSAELGEFYTDLFPHGGFPAYPSDSESITDQPTFEDFVGSESCEGCHKEIYDKWAASTHGRAGAVPSKEFVIGKFNSEPLKFKDATVIPSLNDNEEFTFTIYRDGMDPLSIPVSAVVGRGHMIGGGTQTYFARFGDGTLRMLPFDFIRQENLWFVQLKKDGAWTPISENISLDELYHWPPFRILGTQDDFSNCQNCHGSQIQVSFDENSGGYQTKVKSLDINCESCHGPGKEHVELASSGDINDSDNIGFKPLELLNKDESLNTCFQCHATKDPVKEGFLPGKELEEYYSLKLPLLGGEPFLSDGRVNSFGYQLNHLYSSCYFDGSMTCVDCHDPHSQGYRDIYDNALVGKFDDNQCLDCHPSKAESPESHSFHESDSEGNKCTSCHMPFLQHRGIGSELRFSRSDHTIPIPRPSYDNSIGIENACSKCHKEKSIEFLDEKVSEWYGKLKPLKPSIGAFKLVNKIKDRQVAATILLPDSLFHEMATAAGLAKFIKGYLKPDMPSPDGKIIERLKLLAENEDLDIKSLALLALHFSFGNREEIHAFLTDNINSLGDNEISVRERWSKGADYLGSLYATQGDYESALTIYIKALEVKPNDLRIMSNLAVAYANQPDFGSAIDTYNKILKLDPYKISAYSALARVYESSGNSTEALKTLNSGLTLFPNDINLNRMSEQYDLR